eukprot:1493826-Rhodomonas_salina.1
MAELRGEIVDARQLAIKGFGFIRPLAGGDNIYFHVNSVYCRRVSSYLPLTHAFRSPGNADAGSLTRGEHVTYTLGQGRKGPQGENVKAASGDSAPDAAPVAAAFGAPTAFSAAVPFSTPAAPAPAFGAPSAFAGVGSVFGAAPAFATAGSAFANTESAFGGASAFPAPA